MDESPPKLDKQGFRGSFPPGSQPNSGGDSKENEKEERLRREEEVVVENRRLPLLEQDRALADQEEIVQKNWESFVTKGWAFPMRILTSNKALATGYA